MIRRDFDAAVVRWMNDCVKRGSHRFNSAGTCMDCGAPKRGPETTLRGGPRREKSRRG